MKVLVCGSRGWTDEDSVYVALDRLLERAQERGEDTMELMHGGADGADIIGYWWALDRSPEVVGRSFLPDYKAHGKRAPHVRNDAMLAQADYVIAFWDGKSRGTKSVIRKAAKRGIEFEVHAPEGVEVDV